MSPTALRKQKVEDLSDESTLKKIEALAVTPAMKEDYIEKPNRLRLPNKTILQIHLDININKRLNESDQVELLECLNALNEF